MFAVTLHDSDRYKPIEEIPEPRATQLRIVQQMYPDRQRDDLPIFYVPDNRDLSCISPVSTGADRTMTRIHLQPLLDALEKGDVELACALAPEGKRLCGYRVASEPFERYGGGEYAADYWTIQIPAGVYPIFANQFAYDEVAGQFTNELESYPGLLCWYDGTVIHDNLRKDEIGTTRPIYSMPYGHELARSILRPNEWNIHHESPQKIHLIYPFQAKQMSHEFNGKTIITHSLVDNSLPEHLPKHINPIHLRNGGLDLVDKKPELDVLLQCATQRAGVQPGAPGPDKEIAL